MLAFTHPAFDGPVIILSQDVTEGGTRPCSLLWKPRWKRSALAKPNSGM